MLSPDAEMQDFNGVPDMNTYQIAVIVGSLRDNSVNEQLALAQRRRRRAAAEKSVTS